MALMSKWFTGLTLHVHRLVITILAACAPPPPLPPAPALRQLGEKAFAVDADALLLNKPSPGAAAFPAYFLVAVEAGSYTRGLVLLALYPILRALPLPRGARVRAMAMVAFCGLRRVDAAWVGRAVLPKLFSRQAEPAVEALLRALPPEAKVVAVSQTFPTVMVEAFLKEYVGLDAVVGRELKGGPRYLTGAMTAELDTERVARDVLERTDKTTMTTTSCGGGQHGGPPRTRPKPVVFHDGRLAFTPTPAAALAMYIYLPLGVVLAVVQIAIYVLLPWRVSAAVAALAGVRVRVTGNSGEPHHHPHRHGGGRLYACNHRTLVDAVAVASALRRPLVSVSVSYALGRLAELLSPIPQRRLTREREEDWRRMRSMLARGDLVMSPEGTTCREPYLLRFSPLFAELVAEVTPVAVDARTSVFYATSTSSPLGKVLDSVYFLMNPRPEYRVRFLPPVSTANKSSIEVANEVQRAIAAALGFEATTLTRKDKYLLLAGNEGIVKAN